MITKIKELKESISIKGNEIAIVAVIKKIKEGDYFVYSSPTFLVSGYGETEQEAYESYQLNMEIFFEDLLELDKKERDAYLTGELGLVREEPQNLSELYVDKNGILQVTKSENTETSIVEIIS
jgi:predicted RNase H-like HicB family nuclease